MIELGLFAIAAFWVVCAVLTQGMLVAYAQYEFPEIATESWRSDLGFGILLGLIGGPITLFVAFCMTGFAERGFQWRRK